MKLRQFLEQLDSCGGVACPIQNPTTTALDRYEEEKILAVREGLVALVTCNQNKCFLITSRGKSFINILKGDYAICPMMRS